MLFILVWTCIDPGKLSAQDIASIGKTPAVNISGGMSFNQVLFGSNDTLSLRDPYAYTLMANLNLSVYGWSVPLSAIYSNRQWSYQQPFNQFSLHPTYKWIKTHIGTVSMSFSPYTLNGHQFTGGGIELTPPGKFKISAMAGRLQKRILPDTSGLGEPAYKRFGTGIQAEYTLPAGSIGTSVFYASDENNPLPMEDSVANVFPSENLSLGFTTNFTFLRDFNISADYALSTLTENMFSPRIKEDYTFLPGFRRKASTRQYHAFKGQINYNSKLGSLGVGLERIDPGYRTLGAYYNSNDFVNYTINYAGGILNNKVTLALNYGLQRDNLNGNKAQDTKRTVGNMNIGFTPSEKLNLSLFYSNFNNYTHVKSNFENINNTSPYGHLDTLDFTQISENIGLSGTYNFGNKEKISHSVNASLNYQKASQNQTDNPGQAGSAFYTGVAGYNTKFSKLDLSPGLMFNYSQSQMDSMKTEMIGPSLSLRKGFLNHKLNVTVMLSYNTSRLNRAKQGDNTLFRISSGYAIKQKHNLDLSFVNAWRNNNRTGRRRESTLTLTYRYSFGWEMKKKQENNEK
ncbi:MAG: hypothetical protein HC830_14450 [Bacteroidetes bacterium]|nr:hypothetical protein [Bacteroidota bacterium]